MPILLDTTVSFDEDTSTNDLIIKRSQEIPDDFISDLKREKIDTLHTPTGDFYRVASIPVSVVDDLKRKYNFDVMTAPVRETLAMLKRYDLDAFITTSKRI